MRARVAFLLAVLGGIALLASACGGSGTPKRAASAEEVAARASHCAGAVRASWQQVANRIHAPVFCPSWLPDPFTGKLHDGRWNTIYSVAKDRSYLMGFIWLEAGSGELHVNLRGYPGRTKVPTCTDTEITGGKTTRTKVPCFDDRQGTKRIGGRTVTIYTRNQRRRPLARPLRVALPRLAVHGQPARDRAAHVREGRPVAEPDHARARRDPARQAGALAACGSHGGS